MDEMILDIGIGIKPLGTINLDVVANPLCDIMGDVQYLPFRDNIIPRVICKAVIEHVNYPRLALSEIKRVLVSDGITEIGVPKKEFTNNSLYYLIFFLIHLPLSMTPKFIKMLSRKIKQINTKDVALYHKHIITQNLVDEYFNIENVIEYGDILYSFLNSGRKSKYFRNKPRINTAYLFICKKEV